MSYTTFAYSSPKVTPTKDGFRATVTVKNTGKVVGKEVVELYVSAPAGNLVKPEQELKGFAKTKELQPGESQTLTIDVDLYSLASFNDTVDQWETAAGNYTVKFGANVEDIRCTAPFKLAKEQTWKALDILLKGTKSLVWIWVQTTNVQDFGCWRFVKTVIWKRLLITLHHCQN